MNDFGEMSTTGAVLSNSEMKEMRLKRGECVKCGQKCFKKSLFKQTPINIHGRVLNGRCLTCKPLKADEVKVLPAEVNIASTRELARANLSKSQVVTGNSHSAGSLYHQKPDRRAQSLLLMKRGQSANSSSVFASDYDETMLRDLTGNYTGGSGRSVDSGRRSVDSGRRSVDSGESSDRSSLDRSRSRSRSIANSSGVANSSTYSSNGNRSQYSNSNSTQYSNSNSTQYSNSTQHSNITHHSDSTNYSVANSAVNTVANTHYSNDNHTTYTGGTHYSDSNNTHSSNDNHTTYTGGTHYSDSNNTHYSNDNHTTYTGGTQYSNSNNTHYSNSTQNSNSTHNSNDAQLSVVNSVINSVAKSAASANSVVNSVAKSAASANSVVNSVAKSATSMNSVVNSVANKSATSANSFVNSVAKSGASGANSSTSVNSSANSTKQRKSKSKRGFFSSGQSTSARKISSDSDHDLDHPSASANLSGSLMEKQEHSNSFRRRNRMRKQGSGETTASSRTRILANGLQERNSTAKREGRKRESKRVSPIDSEELKGLETLNQDDISLNSLIDIVTAFPKSKEIQIKAMHKLSVWTETLTVSEQNNAIYLRDNIDAVMYASDFFSSDERIQLDCCSILRNLTASKTMQIAMTRCGGINCIINAMEGFPDNIEIQKIAIETLTKIGQNEGNQLKILKRGGDKRIVASMVRHNDCFEIMDLGCVAIINLAADDYSLKTAIVQSDGADQIINAMVVYHYSSRLIQHCLSALRILCIGHDENKVQIVRKGALDSIVSVMQLYRNDKFIQEEAAHTLYVLASTQESALAIGTSGGIDMIILGLWVHSQYEKAQLQCSRALEVLSRHTPNATLMLEIGAIPAIIHAMQERTGISAIQDAGCGVLLNLAVLSNDAKIKIVEEEALDAISISMVLHKNIGTLQRKACRVLNNLICEQNLEAIHAANAPELMNTAAINFPSECHKEASFMVDMLERITRAS